MNLTTINEKLQKLQGVKERLKSEYIGIDPQIDQLIEYVTPWYCTPEILDKPALVFLAGMTGNGKTSLVRKLLAYLGIDKQLYFDCGEESSSNAGRLSYKLRDLLSDSDEYGCRISQDDNPYDSDTTTGRSIAFIFDEFQYCRSIDEDGKEVDKGNIRAIWNLIDSGVVDDTSTSRRKEEYLIMTECIRELSVAYPDLQLSNLEVLNHREEIKQEYFWQITRGWCYNPEEEKNWRLLDSDLIIYIKRLLDSREPGLGRKVLNQMNQCSNLHDLLEILEEYKKLINKPKLFNCSKSIVFILGNIDEAFGMHDDLSPDINADVFHESSLKVNVTTIKNALKRRVRVEQLSRLGNNMIIYPGLGEKDFKKIIINELGKIKKKMSEWCDLEFSEKIIDLIYSEGVYPAQGVRPTITTVHSMISPRLSNIILRLKTKSPDSKVIIDTLEDNFECQEATMIIKYPNGDSEEYKLPLTLGPLRDIKKDKYLKLKAIHEASHAVVYSYRTGNIPENIISLTSDGGGLMIGDQKDLNNCSFRDIDNRVMTSLAGYYGEHEFFEWSKCTIGAEQDLEKAWDTFSTAIYDKGYAISNKICKDPRTSGSSSCAPEGFSDRNVNFKINGNYQTIETYCKVRFEELCEETKKIIRSEKGLIREMALVLCSKRTIKSPEIKSLIETYGNSLTEIHMEKTRDYYNNYEI